MRIPHPDNWLEPDFRREFRKFVELSAHIIFTGHEHQQDNHWNESSTGEHTAYIEADALQDKSYPRTSGFNCLLIDFHTVTQKYFHFRWKKDRYSPIVDGQIHETRFTRKSQDRFEISDSFRQELIQDDFGFTHKYHPDLVLGDFFVYPPISLSQRGSTNSRSISGSEVLNELLHQQCVFLRGWERAGKTSLLKTLYLDISKASTRIPLLLSGLDLVAKPGDLLRNTVRAAIRVQYGPDAVELFEQLPSNRRIIMIDDFQKARMNEQAKRIVLRSFKEMATLVIVASTDLPNLTDHGAASNDSQNHVFSAIATLQELPPSSRAEIVRKWLRLGNKSIENEASFTREVEREQNVLTDLIRRKALPSLPYLVIGVLQIRQNSRSEATDPGSFGFLFQRLVTDALSITTTSRPQIDRKDGILKRFAYVLYHANRRAARKMIS